MLHVREVTAIDDIKALQWQWDDLLTRAENHSIFQTWEWNYCCCKHFAKDKNIFILSIWDDNKLTGLVPMQINHLWKLPVRKLQFIGYGISDYLDFIVDSKMESAVLSCIYEWLDLNNKRWDILDLQPVPESSAIFRYHNIDRLNQETINKNISYSISLPKTYDEYLEFLGRKTRSDLKYHTNLTNRNFNNIDYHLYGISDFQSGLNELFRLHTLRWQKCKQSGVLAESGIRNFYIDAAEFFVQRGWLRLESLIFNNDVAAIDMNFTYRRKVYGYIRGFNLEYSRFSPGSLLMAKSIELAIEQGVSEFDFMKGNESYKKHWTNSQKTSLRILTKNRSVRSQFGAMVAHIDSRIGSRTRNYYGQLKNIAISGLPQASTSPE